MVFEDHQFSCPKKEGGKTTRRNRKRGRGSQKWAGFCGGKIGVAACLPSVQRGRKGLRLEGGERLISDLGLTRREERRRRRQRRK